MTRKTKVRAWDKENNQWAYFDLKNPQGNISGIFKLYSGYYEIKIIGDIYNNFDY